MIEKQLLHGMPARDYHALPGLSSSSIKHLLRSPAHFETWRKTPNDPTPQMKFGTVVHAAILEPASFDGVAYVLPADTPDKRTKDGKAWWIEAERVANGRILLTVEDHKRVQDIVAAVRATPASEVLLGDGYVETTALWQITANGVVVPCRARPDFMLKDCSVIVDLKTTADATPAAFARSIWNFRYDIQALWYTEGIAEVTEQFPHLYLFCAVETEPPYGVAWYEFPLSECAMARDDVQRAVDLYAYCASVNEWPGYTDEVRRITLPRYARPQIDLPTEG